MHPKFEAGNYCSYEFDPQADFNQFLKEAKSHVYEEGNFKDVPVHVGETRKPELHGEKRNRKSWKSSLFSWLKMYKKNKNMVEPVDGNVNPKVRRGSTVSGPILGTAGSNFISRSRKPASGPLTSLFNPSKREEDGMAPYMCLNQLNNPHDANSYGPVYLVT